MQVTRREFGALSAAAAMLPGPVAAAGAAPLPRCSETMISLRQPSLSGLATAARYQATRLEWTYVDGSDFVRQAKARLPLNYVSGAINANIAPASPDGLALDFDGKPIVAPWMRAWGARWVTTASAATRTALLAAVDRALAAGCDGIQVDDGTFQLAAEPWGGDFSAASLAGFGPWLASHAPAGQLGKLGIAAGAGFDYRRYLQSSAGIRGTADYVARRTSLPSTGLWRRYLGEQVLGFWDGLRSHVRARATPGLLAMNFGRVTPTATFSAFTTRLDYVMTEIQADDPPWRPSLDGAVVEAAARPFVASISGRGDVASLRRLIAATFAAGSSPIVPWDGYVPAVGGVVSQRFSPDPTSFADLYAFARARPQLLDGTSAPARVGLLFSVDAYSAAVTEALAKRLGAASVPYRAIMTGGDLVPRALDERALAGLSAVILLAPPAVFGAATMGKLRATGLPLLDAASVADQDLAGWSLGGFDGLPRLAACRATPFRLVALPVLHIVAQDGAASPLTGTLRLSRAGGAGLVAARRWRLHQPAGAPSVITPNDASDAAYSYDLPHIADWAILEPLGG